MTIDIHKKHLSHLVNKDSELTKDDELAIAVNISTWQKLLERNADESNEDTKQRVAAQNSLDANAEDFENYDLDKVIADINQRYNVNPNDRRAKYDLNWKKTNPSKYAPNASVLSDQGTNLFNAVPNYQSYIKESWKDVTGRLGVRALDDVTFGLLGANKDVDENMAEVDPSTGLQRKQFVPAITPFGAIISPAGAQGIGTSSKDREASDIDILKAMTEGSPVPYRGILKDNPNFADASQFTVGMLMTVPFEINHSVGAIRKIAGKDNPAIDWANKILTDNPTNAYSITTMVNRMRAKGMLSDQQSVFDVGIENAIKQARSDAMFTNMGIIATYGAGQGLEGAFEGFENNPIWQFAQIPALIVGSQMIPRKLFNAAAYVKPGMGGPNNFKKSVWFLKGGGDIDDFLTSVAGISKEAVSKLKTFDQKLELAKITKLEYKRLQDLGRRLSDLKEIDLPEYQRHIKFMDMVIDKRNTVAEDLATSLGYKNFDELSLDQPGIAENLDITLDSILESDSLRGQRYLLNKGDKIPAFANIDPRNLQSSAQRVAKQEAGKRAILAESLKALLDKSESKGAARKFLEQAQNFNDNQTSLLQGVIKRGDNAAELRKLEIEDAFYEGADVFSLDLTDVELDSLGDIEGINSKFEFFKTFGYQPTGESLRNLEKGLTASGESIEQIEARKLEFTEVKTPLGSFADESRDVFFGKFNAAKKEIDKTYKNARSSMEGRQVLVSDEGVLDSFTNIIERLSTDPSKPVRSFTKRTGNVSDFKTFYKNTANQYIDTLVTDNNKESILQLVRNVNPDIDKQKIVKLINKEPVELLLDDPRVTARDIANNFAKPLIKKGQILDTGIDLNDIQNIRSNLLDRARSAYGTVEGKELMDLADDWGIILEAGSAPYLDDENVVTFIEANKKFAESWVPLFKQGPGKKVLERAQDGTSRISGQDIFRSFFDNDDPVAALVQYKKIFGDDEKAKALLKKGIARHVETGGKIGRETIIELRQKGILIDDEVTSLLSATGISGRKAEQKRISNNLAAMSNIAEGASGKGANRGGPLLLKNLASLSGNNPNSVYDIIAKEFDEVALEEAVVLLASKGYVGGGAQAKRDILEILAKPIQEKVFALGDELATDGIVGRVQGAFSSTGKQMKKLLGKTADELEAESVLPEIKQNKKFTKWYSKNARQGEEMAESIIRWQEELDSKALQMVLDEIGPQLKYLDPEHYRKVNDIFGLGVFTDKSTGKIGTSISGQVKGMSVESIISRIYSINRGVVSPRYVATEAVVQLSRKNSQEVLRQILSDPKTPTVVLDVMRGSGLKSPDTKAKWVALMRGWFVYDNDITDEQIYEATVREIDSVMDIPGVAVDLLPIAKNVLGSRRSALKTVGNLFRDDQADKPQ